MLPCPVAWADADERYFNKPQVYCNYYFIMPFEGRGYGIRTNEWTWKLPYNRNIGPAGKE